MRMPAIDDHVMVALHSWYTEVARWVPTAKSSSSPCLECRASTLAESLDLDPWPHDLVHGFVVRLSAVERDIAESYREEQEETLGFEGTDDRDARLACNIARVRTAVSGILSAQSRDTLDVLQQCIAERELERS